MNQNSFPPAKRRGAITLGVILAVLSLVSAVGFVSLSRLEVGPAFVGFLLLAMLAFIPIPYFFFRLYSLSRADYELGRDAFIIHWGLRMEEIPLSDIEWVRAASDLSHPLTLPVLPVPGAIIGMRRHEDIGLVEFIASDASNLLLVATARRVFAISPENAHGFVQSFARAVEMGSLSPAEARSIYPTFVVTRAWDSVPARFLWLTALFLNLGLLIWVSTLIPALPQIAVRINAGQGIVDSAPSTQLIILPLASTMLNVVGWLAGLGFYRWEKQRPLAFIVWASGALASLAFVLALLFIINTPV